MARRRQTETEIKLYQIDTMVYLGTKNIKTKLLMFTEFLKAGGVAVADRLNLNRARALERFDENYSITDLNTSTKIGQANETWLRKNGLLYSVGGRYELSQIANAIISEKISLTDYCFLLLSKQWIKIKKVGGQDEYKDNLLSVILEDLLELKSIPVGDFVNHVGQIALIKYENEYKGLTFSNQEAARYLIDPLLISGLITESNGNYVISSNIVELVNDYVSKANGIKRIDQVSCADEEYWNSFEYGIYDIINEENKPLYVKHYPHLFYMKKTYKDNYSEFPLQKIFYGAPGTGKSHEIKTLTKGKSVIRTTFHPDSDYSTFVGAYKPVMEDADVRVVPVVLNNGASFDQNNGTFKEKRISYKFVKQAFLKAYLGAWKKYAKAVDKAEPQFLVIEEINRGNCAQIFGDLFQLLDRNDDNNFSTYPIEADTDLQKEIEKAFKDDKDGESENPYKLTKDIEIDGAVEDYTSNYGSTLSKDVQQGRVLLFPPNLYIWATMNTSDQSLFPIDSAFKRRWAWDYVKIIDGKKGWMIQGADYSCDWWTFIQEINKKIATATSSDDKKLGYFFCKAKKDETIIDEKTFVSKVIFYLWNDVFKDNDNSIFKVTETNGEPSFDDFYMENEVGEIVTDSSSVKKFLINVVGDKNVVITNLQSVGENQDIRPSEQESSTTSEDE